MNAAEMIARTALYLTSESVREASAHLEAGVDAEALDAMEKALDELQRAVRAVRGW